MRLILALVLGATCLAACDQSLAQKDSMTPAAWSDSTRALRHSPHVWLATDEVLYPILPHGFAFDGIDNDNNGRRDLQDPAEILWDVGSPSVLLDRWLAAKRRENLPPACLLYSVRERAVRSRFLTEYWFYYLLDMGTGSHAHDGEHVFVFTDTRGPNSKIVAVECGAHTDGSRTSILLANPNGGNTRVWPTLPNHMPILVELGKHASAPDRELDGRYSIYQDGNYGEQDTWGLRDVGASLGVNKIGKTKSYYSYERSLGTVISEEYWVDHVADNKAPVDQAWGNEVDNLLISKLQCDKYRRPPGSYSLFPLEVMEDLVALLADPTTEKSKVEKYLREHFKTLWFNRPVMDEPENREPWRISYKCFDLMRSWAKDSDYKRDVWQHPKHLDPEEAFKVHLNPRFAVGAGAEWGEDLDLRLHVDWGWSRFLIGGNGVLSLDVGLVFPGRDLYLKNRFFKESVRDVRIRFQNYRGRHLGPYLIPVGISRLNGEKRRSIVGLGYQLEFWHGALYTSVVAEQTHLFGKVEDIYWKVGFRLSKTLVTSKHPLDKTAD